MVGLLAASDRGILVTRPNIEALVMISETPLHALVAQWLVNVAHWRSSHPDREQQADAVEECAKELAALLLTAEPQETPKVTPTNQVLTTLMILREQGYLGVDVAEALKLAGLAKQEHRQVHVICPQCGTPFETEVLL